MDALLQTLEDMAKRLDASDGQRDDQVHSQIQHLKQILDQQRAAVDSETRRMMQLSTDENTLALEGECTSRMEAIDNCLAEVDKILADDKEVAPLLANLLQGPGACLVPKAADG